MPFQVVARLDHCGASRAAMFIWACGSLTLAENITTAHPALDPIAGAS
jgi:hypothetical protein